MSRSSRSTTNRFPMKTGARLNAHQRTLLRTYLDAHTDKISAALGGCHIWRGLSVSTLNKAVGSHRRFTPLAPDETGRRISARRIAWAVTHGAYPPFPLTTTCGDDFCINPEHLKPFTNHDLGVMGRAAYAEKRERQAKERAKEEANHAARAAWEAMAAASAAALHEEYAEQEAEQEAERGCGETRCACGGGAGQTDPGVELPQVLDPLGGLRATVDSLEGVLLTANGYLRNLAWHVERLAAAGGGDE